MVQSVFAIPLVVRIVYPSLLAVEANTREQAMTDGANGWQLFRSVDYPLLRPVMKTAIAFSALVSLGEFGVASLLTFGDQATIPVLMYQLISRPGAQNYGMALAVASILTLLTIVIVLTLSQDGSKKSQMKLARH
jgi:thiamine transport system permease protein